MKFSKGSGSVFGHHLPNGEWRYHNLTSIQSSRLRDLINDEGVEKLNSLRALLFKMSVWLKEPQDRYQEALEQGFNVEFHPVVPAKRSLEDASPDSTKTPKAIKPTKPKPSNDKGSQGSSNEASSGVHPPNKCAGRGNKFEWQRAQSLPVCSKSACTFASHPDYNDSSHWASSEVAKAYAKFIKNKKGDPARSLTQNKRLVSVLDRLFYS